MRRTATITTRLYRSIDRLLDGQLEQFLRTHRAQGLAWDAISLELVNRTGVEVTGQTLRVWSDQLGINTPDPEKAA